MSLIGSMSRLLRIYYWETARFFLHTTVTYYYLLLYSSLLHVILVTDLLVIPNKFIMNAWASSPYLFSIWAMVVETLCFCSYSVMDGIKVYCLINKNSKLYSSLRPRITNFVRMTLFSIVFPLSMVLVLVLMLFMGDLVNNIFFSIVFPLLEVIAMLFWTFYSFDRELIYPKILDNYFSPFLNHILHTHPVPVSILYMFFDIKEEPPKWESLKLLTVAILIYSLVFTYANINKDGWIYPVLDFLTPSQTQWVIALAVMSAYVSLFLGYYIFSKIKDFRSYFGENKLKSH